MTVVSEEGKEKGEEVGETSVYSRDTVSRSGLVQAGDQRDGSHLQLGSPSTERETLMLEQVLALYI